MTDIKIIGTGMAGCGAAHRLEEAGIRPVIYDKNSFQGGHTASFSFENQYIFDDGPHISFTENSRVKELLAQSVNSEFERIKANVNNYYEGHWVKHPAQCNLYGLPPELITKCLEDFISAQNSTTDVVPQTYEDWLIASFGETFARNFPMRYGEKYHSLHASKMNTSWLGPRLYRPKLEEVLFGAVSPTTPDVHYIDKFRYPTKKGFVAYLDMFLRHADVKLDHAVQQIDVSAKTLQFKNGSQTSYDRVISSIPLPEIVKLIPQSPDDVLEAGAKLTCSSCVLVNVVLDREDLSENHWTYFYDPDIPFARLSFPHIFSPENVPRGQGSIQAEIYFSDKYKPFSGDPESLISSVVESLRKCGYIREDDTILFQNAWYVPYANVIFDLEEEENRKIVHEFLDEVGIAYCGRYGDWGYMWTDESFLSGERAADRVLSSL